jgi:hypothetical protein
LRLKGGKMLWVDDMTDKEWRKNSKSFEIETDESEKEDIYFFWELG